MLQIAQNLLLLGVTVFFLGIELIVLYRMLTGRMNLSKLIAEDNGNASLSRFQFLIFTFVVASIFAIKAFQAPEGTWPTIPAEVLGLIGISGGSYIVSKGIQKNAETAGNGEPKLEGDPGEDNPEPNPGGDRWKR